MVERWQTSRALSSDDGTKTDSETITSTITTYLQEKQIDSRSVRGMSFSGAPTLSGHRTGVQARQHMLSLSAIFIHCKSQMLQLACVTGYTSSFTSQTCIQQPHYIPCRSDVYTATSLYAL